jgi:hypothetical protein
MPTTTHITLPNLDTFIFWGVSAYLEELLPYMTAPVLQALSLRFFTQLSYSVPRLLQFMTTTEGFIFGHSEFIFQPRAAMAYIYPSVDAKLYTLYVEVIGRHLDWQISSMAQIFNLLSPLFTAVVVLVLN